MNLPMPRNVGPLASRRALMTGAVAGADDDGIKIGHEIRTLAFIRGRISGRSEKIAKP